MQVSIERYEILSRLGRGAMGEVLRVRDRETDEIVALKRCLSTEKAERLIFRQEIWYLTQLRHPGLLEARSVGETEDGAPFYVMPMVAGQDLPGQQTEAEVRAWLPGVLDALAYIHRSGFVHADLKPENLRRTPEGQVVIMDFGLMRKVGQQRGIQGTPAYMAPEVALGRTVDGRADLYSLGCVLFFALTGSPPFEDPDATVLIQRHIGEPPPGLEGLAQGVSAGLISVVERLLQKRPEERFSSAIEVLKALGLPRPEGDRLVCLEPPLVGQSSVRQALDALLSETGENSHGLTLYGPSAEGKTRWLQEAAADARQKGLRVLVAKGRGTETAAFEALEDWLETILLLATPDAKQSYQAYMGNTLPKRNIPTAPPLDGAAEKVRLHDAIASLAESIADPILFVLDDVEYLDPDSTALLDFLQRRGQGHSWRWLFSAQSSETAPSKFSGIALPRLSHEEADTLAQALLGGEQLPPVARERLLMIGEGVPGVLCATVRHWVERGVIHRVGENLEVPLPENLIAPPMGLAALSETLSQISEDARTLAQWAAIYGEQGSLDALAEPIGFSQAKTLELAAELEAIKLWEMDVTQWSFRKPATLTSLVSAMPPQERAKAHRAFAEVIGASLSSRDTWAQSDFRTLRKLAGHLLGAEDFEKAWEFAEITAKRGFDTGSFRAVLPLIESWLSSADVHPVRLAIMRGLQAYGYRRLGKTDDALAIYDDAFFHTLETGAPDWYVDHVVTRGLLLMLKARYDEARASLQMGATLAERQGLTATLIRARFTEGRIAYFSGDLASALALLESSISAARAAQLDAMLPAILSFKGLIETLHHPENIERGLAQMEAAANAAREFGNLYDETDAKGNLGNALMSAGRYVEARKTFEDYLLLCERQAESSEIIFAELNLATVLFHQGDWSVARARAERSLALSQASKRNFPEAYCLGLLGVLDLFGTPPGEALEKIERGRAIASGIGNSYLAHEMAAFWGTACLFLGDLAGAKTALEDAGGLEGENKGHRLLQNISLNVRAKEQAEVLLALDAQEEFPTRPDLQIALWRAQASKLRRGEERERAKELMARAHATAQAAGLEMEMMEIEVWRARWLGVPPAQPATEIAAKARAAGHEYLAHMALLAASELPGGTRVMAQQARRALNTWSQSLPAALRKMASIAWTTGPASAEGRVAGEFDDIPSQLLLAIASEQGYDQVLKQVASSTGEWFDADEAYILLFEDFEVRHIARWKENRAVADNGVINFAYDAMWAGDAQLEELAGGENHPCLAALPLMDGQRVFGVIVFVLLPEAAALWTARVPAGRQLATMAASALLRAQEDERLRREHRVSQDLASLSLEVLQGTNEAERWQAISRAALQWSRADRLLWVTHSETGELTCEKAVNTEGPLAPEEQLFSRSVSNWSLERQEPIFLLDAQGEDALKGQMSVLALGLRSVFALPVLKQQNILGLLYLDLQHIDENGKEALPWLSGLAKIWGASLSPSPLGTAAGRSSPPTTGETW